MRVVVFWVAVLAVINADAALSPEDDMPLRVYSQTHEDASASPPEMVENLDSGVMRQATLPETHEEEKHADVGTMGMASEDYLDVGGAGEAMQLSLPMIPSKLDTLDTIDTTDTGEVKEVESEVQVSDDMAPEAAAINKVIIEKEATIQTQQKKLEAEKELASNQNLESQKLLKEAYEKQQALNDLANHLAVTAASLDAQQAQILKRQEELRVKEVEVQQREAALARDSAQKQAEVTMSAAIQTQMSALDTRKREIEKAQAEKSQELASLRKSIEEMHSSITQRDATLQEKESAIKRLYVELNEMKKNSHRHEEHLRQTEQQIQKQQEDLMSKEEELNNKIKSLESKLAPKPVLDVAKRLGEQMALQTEVSVQLPLTDLPKEAKLELGVPEEVTFDKEVAQQPPVVVAAPREAHPPAAIVAEPPKLVDLTTRSVETKVDERPAESYKKPLLVGQEFAESYDPETGKDADGLCRNSRGQVVECAEVKVTETVPPVATLTNYKADAGDDTYEVPLSGPCVLKCFYHRGLNSSKQEEIVVQIDTSLSHTVIACPRSSNGFPFVSCGLSLDESDRCQSTCVFDGDANPLKPKSHLGSSDDFRSLAYTTYKVTTTSGCKSSMKADPLVACQVELS